MTVRHLPAPSWLGSDRRRLSGSPEDTSRTPPGSPVADLLAGTWTVDAEASDLTFTVRDMVLDRSLHGRFADVDGLIGLDLASCRAMILVDAGSLSAGSRAQEHWLRSAAFLAADRFPYIWFRSSGRCPRPGWSSSVVLGDLTVRDVTRPARCTVTLSAMSTRDPDGARLAGLLTLSRSAFGLGTDRDRERGGPLLGDRVDVNFDLQVVRRRVASATADPMTEHDVPGDKS
jgi:polyisoprenoid-binding protein YceI